MLFLLVLVLILQAVILFVLIKKQVIEIHRSPSGSIGPFLTKKPKRKPIFKTDSELYTLERENKK